MVAGELDGSVEIYKIEGGKNLGVMRSESKARYIEFSYGDKYLLIY